MAAMKMTVVGAGNVGTQIAVHAAEKGFPVTLFTSQPESVRRELCIVDENDARIHSGVIAKSTNNPAEAFPDADVVFVTYPAFLMRGIAEKMRPFLQGRKPGRIGIVLVPGSGGAECAFRTCLAAGCPVMGLQRVPSVARLVRRGECVRAVGYRDALHLASMHGPPDKHALGLLADLFGIPCLPLPHYLNVTMAPSNPVLHTARLFTLFRDYAPGQAYHSLPLFYEEWDDESSEWLLACDDDLQRVVRALPMFDLSSVVPLREHYESETPEQLTRKIRSIKGFRRIATPSVRTGRGLVPDFSSRYFRADFPYGLQILTEIADFFRVDAPHLKKTLAWYDSLGLGQARFSFANCGIRTQEDFLRFYEEGPRGRPRREKAPQIRAD